MSAPPNPARPVVRTGNPDAREAVATRRETARDDAVICERCGAEMFRMHAVWRCPACRYKTDCCGW